MQDGWKKERVRERVRDTRISRKYIRTTKTTAFGIALFEDA